MAQRTRTKKKPPPAPAPPPPASITVEGFGPYQTPDPRGHYFCAPRHGTPSVGNHVVDVYRYRTTVERIEEPDAVILERMVALYLATTNHHEHTALSLHARHRFGGTLHKLVEDARAAARAAAPSPPPPPPDTPADPGPAPHSSVTS